MDPTTTILLITIFTTSGLAQQQHPEHLRTLEGVIMPGIYMEELDTTTTSFTAYDRVVPLVFEFKLPTTSSSLGSLVLPNLNCRSDNSTGSQMSTQDWLFACPVFYHLNTLLTQLRTNWTHAPFPFTPSASSSTGSTSSSSSSSSSSSFSSPYRSATTFASGSSTVVQMDDECRSQLRAWRGIDTRSDVGLAAYKTIVQKCAVESYFEEGIQDFNVDISAQFNKMRDNLATHFGNNGSTITTTTTNALPYYAYSQSQSQSLTSTKSEGADLIGTMLGLQSLMTTHLAVEMQRWRDVVTSCQNSLVPTSILQSTRLEKALQELRLRLLPKKYTLLLGSTLTSSSSKLYKLKLVDCIFSQNSIFVQILAPVVREAALYKALRVHQPQFLYGGDLVCYVNSNFEAKGAFFQYRNYLLDKTSRLLVQTSCSLAEGGLCRFPDKASRPTTDGCLLAVLLGNMDSIKAFCHLECDKIVTLAELTAPVVPKGLPQQRVMDDANALASNSFPLIQRVDSDKFVVTLQALSTLLVKCESVGRLDELVPPQKYGAVEVVLPCGCYLMFHAERFDAYEPCSSSPPQASMHHVIPVHMINTSIEVPRLNSQQIMATPAALSGSNLRYNMNTRLRYLQPRNRITFPNLTLLINMTFREQDIVGVHDDDEDKDILQQSDSEGQLPQGIVDQQQQHQHESGGQENDTRDTTEGGSPPSTSSTLPSVPTYADTHHHHSALWALLAAQGIVIALVTVFLLYKLKTLERRMSECKYAIGGQSNGGVVGVGAISFSANHPSQVTLDKF